MTGKQERVLIIILSLVSVLLRLPVLTTQSLWFDEAFTVLIARQNWPDTIPILLADGVHPPLFYWIEKLWISIAGDHGEYLIRLPAFLAGVSSVPLLYWLGRRWVGNRVAAIAACLLAISPFHIWFSQDARMYTSLALMSIAVMGLYVALFEASRRREQVSFVVTSAIAYGLHYFALFLPFVQFIHLVIYLKKRPLFLRQWVLLQLIAALPFGIWVVALFRREGNFFGIGWIESSGLLNLPVSLMNFSVGYTPPLNGLHWLGLAVFILALGLGIRASWERPELRTVTILWAFVPMLLIFFISFRRPTYVDRFFIFSLPAFYLISAQALSTPLEREKENSISSLLETAFLGRWVVLALALLMLWGGYRMYFSSAKLRKENWRATAAYLNTNARPDDVVVLRTFQISVPFNYYVVDSAPVKVLETNRVIEPLDEITRDADRTWFVFWNTSSNAHFLAQQAEFDLQAEPLPEIQEILRDPNIHSQGRTNFQGTTIFLYSNQ